MSYLGPTKRNSIKGLILFVQKHAELSLCAQVCCLCSTTACSMLTMFRVLLQALGIGRETSAGPYLCGLCVPAVGEGSG